MQMTLDEILAVMPQSLFETGMIREDEPSNIRKIIMAIKEAVFDPYQKEIERLDQYSDLEGVRGGALDEIGYNWGVIRPTLATNSARSTSVGDDFYRTLIQSTILARFGGNTFESLELLVKAVHLRNAVLEAPRESGVQLKGRTDASGVSIPGHPQPPLPQGETAHGVRLDGTTRLLGESTLGDGNVKLSFSGFETSGANKAPQSLIDWFAASIPNPNATPSYAGYPTEVINFLTRVFDPVVAAGVKLQIVQT